MPAPASSQRSRANGNGTVFQRKDGRWVAQLRDPRTKQRRSKYAKSKAEAETALAEMVSNAKHRKVVLGAGASIRAYSVEWFDGRAGRRRSEATVGQYQQRFDLYVLPHLGSWKLADLYAPDVEDWLEVLSDQGLSKSTIQGALNALKAMLSDACRQGHLPVNEARAAELPRSLVTKTVEPPTSEQVGKLFAAVIESKDQELLNLLTVVALTGCRIGEALALRWSDVDFDGSVAGIARTVTTDVDGKTIIGLRTKAGDSRVVVLSPDAVAALLSQKDLVAGMRSKSSVWTTEDLAFPTAIGTVRDPRNVRTRLRPITAKIGYKGSFHSLRHYATVSALEASVPMAQISKALGHKRIATTLDVYGHLTENMGQKFATAVNLAVKLDLPQTQEG